MNVNNSQEGTSEILKLICTSHWHSKECIFAYGRVGDFFLCYLCHSHTVHLFCTNLQCLLPQDILEVLSDIGHELYENTEIGALGGVARGDDGRIYANADFRTTGAVAGF